MTNTEKLLFIVDAISIDTDLAIVNEYCNDLLEELGTLELLREHTSTYKEVIPTTKHIYYYVNNREVKKEVYNVVTAFINNGNYFNERWRENGEED